MEADSVPNHGGVDVGSQRTRKLIQELVDDRRVEHWREDRFGLTGLWARRADDPEVFVFGLTHRCRSRAPFGPDASPRAFLTESAFLLKERDDLLVGMLGLNPRELLRDFFGNAAIASGSDVRCFGRGTNHSSFSA